MSFGSCTSAEQTEAGEFIEFIPVEHHTCLNLSGNKVNLLALVRLINISLLTQKGHLIGVRRKSEEKRQY